MKKIVILLMLLMPVLLGFGTYSGMRPAVPDGFITTDIDRDRYSPHLIQDPSMCPPDTGWPCGMLLPFYGVEIWGMGVRTLAIQPWDGKILIGGDFQLNFGEQWTYDFYHSETGAYIRTGTVGYPPVVLFNLARLNSDGTLDRTFHSPQPLGAVNAISIRVDPNNPSQDSRIYIGGTFTELGTAFDPDGFVVDTVSRNGLARLKLDGSLEDFAPMTAPATVNTLLMEPDGKNLLMGGVFSEVAGVAVNNLARLSVEGAGEGTVTGTFSGGTDGEVDAMAFQAGRLVIGGLFSSPGNNLARYRPDYTLDPGFSAAPDNAVRALALQPDGKVVIGGDFGSVTVGGVNHPRRGLARLTLDGALDGFGPVVEGGSVLGLAVQPDGKVLAAGNFLGIGAGATGPSYFARFKPDGTLEPIDLQTNWAINALALQPDGNLLVAGEFSFAGGQPRRMVARFYPNGLVDDDAIFDPRFPPQHWPATYSHYAIALKPDGSLLVGGYVKDDITGKFVIPKLDQKWKADPSYTLTGVNGDVQTMALQPDGHLVVGGMFNRPGQSSTDETGSQDIFRLTPDGALDPTFQSPFRDYSYDPNIIFNGPASLTLLPKDSRTSKDTWQNGELVPKGSSLEDGMMYVTGKFIQSDATKPKYTVFRLKKNGELDPSFTPPVFNQFIEPKVLSMVIQPDNKIIITVSDDEVTALEDMVPDKMYRLETNGEIDPTFFSPRNTGLYQGQYLYKGDYIALTSQLDRYGQLYIGGWFNELAWDDTTPPVHVTKSGMIRLNNLQHRRADGTLTQDGSPDLDFSATLLDPEYLDVFMRGGLPAAYAFAFQADEKAIAIGSFEGADDGTGALSRESIVRFDRSGKVDDLERLMTWYRLNQDRSQYGHSIVALQNDGKIIVGGDLTSYASYPPRERFKNWSNLQRFSNGMASQELSVSQDGSTITWMRGGSAPEIWGTYFEEADSPDKPVDQWTFLGRAVPIPGGWKLEGQSLARGQNRYLRGVGYQATSRSSLSGGIVHSTRLYYLKPILTVTPNAKSKTYGDPDPGLDFTVTGMVDGDTSAVVTGSVVRDAGVGAGSYPIRPGSIYAGLKYDIDFRPANLTINPAHLTVTAQAKSKFLGDADPVLDYTVSGFVNGDTAAILTGGLHRAAGNTTGVYAIDKGTLSAGPNYVIDFIGADLTILSAAGMTPQTITFNPLPTKTFGHGDFFAAATASSGLAVSYASSNPAVATVDAGTGAIHIVGVGTTNITASRAGNGTYDPAADVVRALVVGPPPGNALALDGINDVMRVGNAVQLNFGAKAGFTIETWLRLSGSQPDGTGIVAKGLAGGGAGGYQLILHQDKLAAELTGAASSVGVSQGLVGTTNLNDGRWHHVALSVDRALGTATLYLDGRVEKTLTDSALGADADNAEDLMVGVNRGGAHPFKGAVDELRLWDSARSTAQIRASMSQIVDPAGNPDLVAYFHFDEGEAGSPNPAVTSAPERTANAADGTLLNFELDGTASNWIASGAFLPLVQTSAVTNIAGGAADSGGEVFDNYYPATDRGLCWGTAPNPTVADSHLSAGNGVGTFAGSLSGLASGTYYLRAFAVNAMGASYGNEISFSTGKASQAITFGAIADATYGDAPITPGATASSGLPVTYTSSNPAVAVIDNGEIRITGAGSTVITASQSGNGGYDPAPDVSRTLDVAKAVVTVAAANKSRAYLAADPAFTVSYSGLVYGETNAVLSGAPALSTTATAASPAGSYPITPAIGTLSAANYTFAFTPGTLTVTPATQTITFGALAGATYGDAPITPSGTASSGLPVSYASSNHAVAVVVGGVIRITGAGSTVITASQPGNGNYTAAPDVPITLEVAKAVLTVTAANKSRAYLAADPAYTASYSGWVNGDTIAVVTGSPAYSTTATAASPAGSYPITPAIGTLSAANYTFAFTPGTLTVTAATQTITFGALAGATYGDAPITPTATASSGLPVSYASSHPAVAVMVGGEIRITGAGSTVITASQPGNGNYLAAPDVSITLEVAKAVLTVAADNKSRPCLVANPLFTFTCQGFVNGDTVASLSGAPSLSTVATEASPAGTYPIVAAAGTLASSNYSFVFVNGALAVGAAAQSITFNAPRAKTFGDGDFDPGASASSGLPVSYVSSAPEVATVVAGRIRVVGPGTAEITASQAGDEAYDPAAEVVRTLTVKPPPGNAVSFDGADDLVRVGNGAQLNFGGKPGFTVEAWLHLSGSQSDGTGLISKGTAAGGAGYQLILHQDRIAAEISDGLSSAGPPEGLVGSTSLNDGRWHHVALSVDRTTATASLYLDGRLEKELSHAALGASPDNAEDLLIGVDRSGARFFRGELDELRLWDAARSRDELRDWSSQIADPATHGHLVGYFHFDEGDAGLPNGAFLTAPERTAHGADGSLEGFALSGPQSNWVRSGAFLPLLESSALSGITPTGASGGGLVYANYYPASDRGLCWGTSPEPSLGESCLHAGSGAGAFAGGIAGLSPGATYHLRAFAVNQMGTAYGNEVTFHSARAGQFITFALPSVTYGDPPIVPSGSSSSGLPVSYTSSNPAVALMVNGEIRLTGAGTAVITASQPGNESFDPAPEIPLTLNVAKAVVTVAADDKSRAYLAADPVFTARYGGFVNGENASVLSGAPALSTTAVAASPVGSYPIVVGPGTLHSANYTFALVSGALSITPAAQSITAGWIPALTYGDPPYLPTCTSTSGLPVSYASSDPAVAVPVNGEIRITGAGTCTITASQPGGGNWAAASPVAIPLAVAKAPLTVAAEDKARVYQTPNPPLTAAYSGLVNGETLSVISGEPVLSTSAVQSSPVGDYPILVEAGTLAAANYRFLTVNGTFSVLKSCQQIVFPALSPVTYGDPPFTLYASACSGLELVFSSSNPQVAQISGRQLTIVGAGSAVITASQAGSHSVDSAPDVLQTLVVNRRGQSVTFPPLAPKVVGGAPFALAATSSSGLPVSYQSSEPVVATVAGNTVTVVGAGTTVITALQAGNANYHPSLPVAQPLVVASEATPPVLTLSTLSSGAVTASPVLNLMGSASDVSGIASLTVNGVDLTERAALFSSAVCLASGDNRVTVAATDAAGNRTTETIQVSLDATAPAIRVSEPADNGLTNAAFFTANGVVTPGSAVTMSVNGGSPQRLSVTDGAFTGSSYLAEGLNTVEWTASLQGRSSKVKRSVTYAPGKPWVTLTDPVEDTHTERENLLLKGTAGAEGSEVSVVVDAGGAVFNPAVENGLFQQQIALKRNAQTRVSATVTDRDGKASVAYRNIVHHETIAGDLNGDGRLDIADAMVALRISLGYQQATPQALAHGDLAPLVGGVPQPDGRIDVGDVLVILRRVVGLVDF